MTRIQRAREAEQYLARAAAIDSTNPEAITRLGIARASLGRRDDAANLFNRALSLEPGYAPAQRAIESLRRQPHDN